jgi:hypothetical protein
MTTHRTINQDTPPSSEVRLVDGRCFIVEQPVDETAEQLRGTYPVRLLDTENVTHILHASSDVVYLSEA